MILDRRSTSDADDVFVGGLSVEPVRSVRVSTVVPARVDDPNVRKSWWWGWWWLLRQLWFDDYRLRSEASSQRSHIKICEERTVEEMKSLGTMGKERYLPPEIKVKNKHLKTKWQKFKGNIHWNPTQCWGYVVFSKVLSHCIALHFWHLSFRQRSSTRANTA